MLMLMLILNPRSIFHILIMMIIIGMCIPLQGDNLSDSSKLPFLFHSKLSTRIIIGYVLLQKSSHKLSYT